MNDPVVLFFEVAILIMSVIVHELAHGYVADFLGDKTARMAGRLTINPISHIDPLGSVILPILSFFSAGFIFGWAKPVPYNPYNLRGKYAEVAVAGAGAFANLCLAIIFGLTIRFAGAALPASFIDIASAIVFINVLLAVFNLVPIPPLDGSKVLFGLLPFRFQHWSRSLERWSFAILIFFVFFLWQYVTPLISFIAHLIIGS
jgi:Zn-dependent protease